MKPNLIDQTLLTENYFNLSIRHEIFRRKVLNLEIPESLIYGYIIECCLKNLAQEKKRGVEKKLVAFQLDDRGIPRQVRTGAGSRPRSPACHQDGRQTA